MIALKPKRVEERYIKRQQKNKRLLMENELLNINNLCIDNLWNFDLNTKYIKCKKIIGDVWLDLNHIPGWMKDIEIDGPFDCGGCSLTNLKNCPKIIYGSFSCNYNSLTCLEDGPTYVGRNYWCYNNSIKFTEKYVRSFCDVKNDIFV